MGYSFPFKERTFWHKNFELELENQSAGLSHYYIKIRSSQKADIRIAVRSLNRFIFYALTKIHKCFDCFFEANYRWGFIGLIGMLSSGSVCAIPFLSLLF